MTTAKAAFGAGQYQVARRLGALLEALIADVPEKRRPPLVEQGALLDDAVSSAIPQSQRAAALVPDRQGIGMSRRRSIDGHRPGRNAVNVMRRPPAATALTSRPNRAGDLIVEYCRAGRAPHGVDHHGSEARLGQPLEQGARNTSVRKQRWRGTRTTSATWPRPTRRRPTSTGRRRPACHPTRADLLPALNNPISWTGPFRAL